jgi:hypothetical protein
MISQSKIIDYEGVETIKKIVLLYQPIIKSDYLGIFAMFWIMKYKVKVLDKTIGNVIVQAIVYYDNYYHDYYFDIEHQLYQY